jgi:geranylgeranyl reductase
MTMERFDVVVVGGGPAGATAAHELASRGVSVLLLDKAGRIKPCGGAVPPQLLRDFDVPESLMVARIHSARIISPRGRNVDIPVGDGFVGMVDRDVFDEWLRVRATQAGAVRRTGIFQSLERADDGDVVIKYTWGRSRHDESAYVKARYVVGADGALSAVARQAVPQAQEVERVFAYHEIIESPTNPAVDFDPTRCDVYYRGALSPDFYAWIFPHGKTTSVGTGSFEQGFTLKKAVDDLRQQTGMDACRTIRREGAPIPLRPLSRWDDGRNVVLAGDASGVVAPASGEGIFYAMTGGRHAAEAVAAALTTRSAKHLATARKHFMSEHGQVFRVLRIMQHYWYNNESRRERFVAICRDEDVQRLTFDAYMNKRLVRAKPLAHLKIFLKNVAHLTGLATA